MWKGEGNELTVSAQIDEAISNSQDILSSDGAQHRRINKRMPEQLTWPCPLLNQRKRHPNETNHEHHRKMASELHITASGHIE